MYRDKVHGNEIIRYVHGMQSEPCIYSPCLGHDVERLRGPCCPRGVLMIVLRGSGPPLPDALGFNRIPVFQSNFPSTFQLPKCRPRAPKIIKNDSQNDPRHQQNTKSLAHEILPKPSYLQWFGHIQPPLDDTLAIKNACRRRHTDVPSNVYGF